MFMYFCHQGSGQLERGGVGTTTDDALTASTPWASSQYYFRWILVTDYSERQRGRWEIYVRMKAERQVM